MLIPIGFLGRNSGCNGKLIVSTAQPARASFFPQ
jgi:hypothetical protein